MTVPITPRLRALRLIDVFWLHTCQVRLSVINFTSGFEASAQFSAKCVSSTGGNSSAFTHTQGLVVSSHAPLMSTHVVPARALEIAAVTVNKAAKTLMPAS